MSVFCFLRVIFIVVAVAFACLVHFSSVVRNTPPLRLYEVVSMWCWILTCCQCVVYNLLLFYTVHVVLYTTVTLGGTTNGVISLWFISKQKVWWQKMALEDHSLCVVCDAGETTKSPLFSVLVNFYIQFRWMEYWYGERVCMVILRSLCNIFNVSNVRSSIEAVQTLLINTH